MAEASDKDVLGCIIGIIQICICLPMQMTLLGSLLYGTDAHVWQWVLFWVLAPVVLLTAIVGQCVKSLLK